MIGGLALSERSTKVVRYNASVPDGGQTKKKHRGGVTFPVQSCIVESCGAGIGPTADAHSVTARFAQIGFGRIDQGIYWENAPQPP